MNALLEYMRENAVTVCNKSLHEMGDKFGLSTSQVSFYLDKLEEAGEIVIPRNENGNRIARSIEVK